MKKHGKLFTILTNLDLAVAMAALVVLVAVTFGGVIFRYFISRPFVWQEEVQLWCFLWVVFFGAGVAFRTGSHVAIEILVDLFPRKLALAVEMLGTLLGIGIIGFLGFQGCRLIAQFIQTNRSTNVLYIPLPLVYAAVPIGCALLLVNLVLFKVGGWRSDSDTEKQEGASWE